MHSETEMKMLDEEVFDDIYGSKYFSVSDLKDGEPWLKVGKVEVAELREKNGVTKRKFVILFEGVDKGLVVNKTNAKKLAEAYGKQSSKWVGQIIQLYGEDTTFGKGVRVRPLRKPATLAEPDPVLNDAVPF
jgi:hypothetical protein